MEKSLYAILLDMAKKHVHTDKKVCSDLFHFNLTEKTIRNGKHIIMEKGKIVGDKIALETGESYNLVDIPLITDNDLMTLELNGDFYNMVEQLYGRYEISVPNAKSIYVKSNFIPRDIDKMTYEEICNGYDRSETMYALEAFLMLYPMVYKVEFNDKHWYWHSENYSKLYIFKKWIKEC